MDYQDDILSLLPYLLCFISLVVGTLFGLLFSFLARKGKLRPRVRNWLTVGSSLLIWVILTIVLWASDQNNPITRTINNGGSLS